MHENFIDSSNDSLDTESPIMSKQIVIPSSNIFNPGDNARDLKKDKDFLGNRSQDW